MGLSLCLFASSFRLTVNKSLPFNGVICLGAFVVLVDLVPWKPVSV